MEWQSYFDDNEKPLERLIEGGGFCSVLRTVGCIGDSLSSGTFETVAEDNETHNCQEYYDYSWPQLMAHTCGIKVHSFSRGGMTAKEYFESFAEQKDFWNEELKCNAYIMALGVNDIYQVSQNNIEIGSIDDIDVSDYNNNKKTILGYYGAIIQRYRTVSKNAPVFVVTAPKEFVGPVSTKNREIYRNELARLPEIFDDLYLIDLYKYAPEYTPEFKEKFYLNNHMNPLGYALTAKMIISYIDYIIRHNSEKFMYNWQINN